MCFKIHSAFSSNSVSPKSGKIPLHMSIYADRYTWTYYSLSQCFCSMILHKILVSFPFQARRYWHPVPVPPPRLFWRQQIQRLRTRHCCAHINRYKWTQYSLLQCWCTYSVMLHTTRNGALLDRRGNVCNSGSSLTGEITFAFPCRRDNVCIRRELPRLFRRQQIPWLRPVRVERRRDLRGGLEREQVSFCVVVFFRFIVAESSFPVAHRWIVPSC